MKSITLTLPYPISANRYWASRIIKAKATGKYMSLTYVTPEAKAYKEQVAWIARAAGIREPIDGRVEVSIRLYPHRPLDWQKRMRIHGAHWDDTVQCIDLGNCEKVLADALQGTVYTDDKWIWDEHKKRMEPDGEARVVVTITALAVEQPQEALFA
jgi:crossover junction endodeoxyribonuclease RusA